jgi:hypothetical protein
MYAAEMTPDDMTHMYMPRFTVIGYGIQVILTVLHQEFDMLQCWYYWRERFMIYAIEMAQGGMIYRMFHDFRA